MESCCIDDDTEEQRGAVTSPRSHSMPVGNPGFTHPARLHLWASGSRSVPGPGPGTRDSGNLLRTYDLVCPSPGHLVLGLHHAALLILKLRTLRSRQGGGSPKGHTASTSSGFPVRTILPSSPSPREGGKGPRGRDGRENC